MTRAQENPYVITRVLNHNVVLVEEPGSRQEYVLFGKGIGFGNKQGTSLPPTDIRIEKRFRLEDETHKKQYESMLKQVDHVVIGISEEIIDLIAKDITPEINGHVHVALPDHIQFAIYRLQHGMEIINPFLFEIQTLYPQEYALAKKAAELIKKEFAIDIPESEIGFLSLHIHSAVSHLPVIKAVQFTDMIRQLVAVIEEQTGTTIERSTIDYMRLITHLRFACERIHQHTSIQNPLLDRVKTTMPDAYKLAEALTSCISARLEVAVPEDETGYMAMHLYRLLHETK
ncbi:glucose PTS transporter transcription antiterminator GlcT [Brevibacillus sp. H7]|uniref:glucose PTS transporter transcription antiterminator GlcT n=1 Tax=Brevibacillus sp. H7 TaxID=3349138 RepID=UPI00380A5DFD